MDCPDQEVDTALAEAGSSRAAGRFWFFVFSTVGVAAMAAAVLLPEYASLARLQRRRDALAYQVAGEEELAGYHDRLILGMEQDPVVAARMSIRHENYSPAGYRPIEIDPADRLDPVPVQILKEALAPPPPPADPIASAGQWMEHRPTRTGLLVLGLGTLVMGLLLFAGRPADAGRA